MKITYLKLKNFATIYTAMNKKSIEIDFTRCKNNVVLLVGANGSGKTSILSTLHPFAYSGNMDVRNNNNIVIEGQDGLKEIHYQVDNDYYIITHHYKSSKDGKVSVKSFISRNDEELNPNGNVRSFLDRVKDELSIELDYLKLLRLGSNVTNMIGMKASERKRFTSDLLRDIDVYNQLYKKINDDARTLKGVIKSVTDKIYNLRVKDKEDIITMILNNEEKLDELKNEKSEIEKELGFIDGVLSSSFPDGEKTFLEYHNQISMELETNYLTMGSLNEEVNMKSMRINYIEGCYTDTEKACNKKYTEIEVLKGKLGMTQDKLNDLLNRLSELEIEYDKIKDSDNTYEELVDKVKELEELTHYPSILESPGYTTQDIKGMVNLLREIDNINDNIQEFGEKAANKVIDLIEDRIEPNSFIDEKLQELNQNELVSNLKKHFTSNGVILYKPVGCDVEGCPMLGMYEAIVRGNTEIKDEYTYDLLESMKSVATNIKYISTLISMNQEIINKFDLMQFKWHEIYKAIRKGKKLFKESIFDPYYNETIKYNEYLFNTERLSYYRVELNELKATSTGKLKDDIDRLKSEIEKERSIIHKLRCEIEENTTIYNTLNKLLKQIAEIEDIKSKIKDLKEEGIKLNEIMNKNRFIILSNKENIDRKRSLEERLIKISEQMKAVETELFNNRFTLKEFNSLSEEKDILDKKYDKVKVIREALSSTKGIPLIFIQLYLKNTKSFVNSLLESVYGDDFYIDDFDINADEFNIPYIKNGTRISDIRYASQGESSFLSVALSFALINQSIKNYNILLLDEIDSTLDIKNRASFLNILERQMNVIDAEQIFLITHNNMFDSYPVDVILTSDVNQENLVNANIIYS